MVQQTYESTPFALAPGFLIRSTGFAVEQLDSLRMPASYRQCDELLAAQARVDDLCARFTDHLFVAILDREQRRGAEAAVFRRWYQLNRHVYRRQPCPADLRSQLAADNSETAAWIDTWNAALEAVRAARSSFEQCCDAELAEVRERLHAIAHQQPFQEALLLSSPNMYTIALPTYLRHYAPERRPAKLRHLERRMYGYLQRFCAKNDTASFFGPIDYGWCDSRAERALDLTFLPGDVEIARRLTRMAYWAAQELADLVAADPAVRPFLMPRVQDGCALLPSGEVMVAALNRRVPLSPELAAAMRQVDGRRTLGAILGMVAEAGFDQLVARGLVVVQLSIPTAAFDPLDWLYRAVAALPDECASRELWLERLNCFRAMIAAFPSLPAERKLELLGQLEREFTALTGAGTRRGEGTIYADRLLIYDEAQGNIDACVVGPALQDDLCRRLRPVCDLCASFSLCIQEGCRRRAAELFMALGQGAPVPYLAFLRHVDGQIRLEDCMADAPVRAMLDALAGLARSSPAEPVIRLRAGQLRPLLCPIPSGTLVSPDIFLSAPDVAALEAGNYQLVVGEIHYGPQVWCHFLTFCEQRDALGAWLAGALPANGERGLRAGLVHRRRQGKTFYLELPGLSVEVLGRSVKPREQVLPAEDLEVVLAESGLVLRSRSLGQPIELYPSDPRSVSNWLFGTPPVIAPTVVLGEYTPRIEIDGVVMQRARWQLAASDLLPPSDATAGSAAMWHANRLRRRYNLPERAFVRVPSERKPFFVDFSSLISIEYFFSMIQASQQITLTELLPDSEGWWLRRQAGRYSCEWRMTFVYGASQH